MFKNRQKRRKVVKYPYKYQETVKNGQKSRQTIKKDSNKSKNSKKTVDNFEKLWKTVKNIETPSNILKTRRKTAQKSLKTINKPLRMLNIKKNDQECWKFVGKPSKIT